MSSRRPFKIQIFVAEGLPEGLRLVEAEAAMASDTATAPNAGPVCATPAVS